MGDKAPMRTSSKGSECNCEHQSPSFSSYEFSDHPSAGNVWDKSRSSVALVMGSLTRTSPGRSMSHQAVRMSSKY